MRERSFLSGEWGQEPGRIQGWSHACGSVLRLECRRLKQRRASQQRELSLKPDHREGGRKALRAHPKTGSRMRRGGHQGGRLGRSPTVTEEEHRH